jgi:hypothetical protein
MRILSSELILATALGELTPEDDIDRLFEKLPKLEPPGDVVKQIMARIKRLPAPLSLPQPEPASEKKQQEAAE